MSWKGIVGNNFVSDSFDNYCHLLQWTARRPSFIVLHNTVISNLAQRPKSITKEHINGLQGYYRDSHLFIDDHQIWVFTHLTVSGTHSPSWNIVALRVEMLGDYETESFSNGRSLAVRKNNVCALATFCAILGLSPSTIRLHREALLTIHACPGENVRKLEIIQEVQDSIIHCHAGEHPIKPVA